MKFVHKGAALHGAKERGLLDKDKPESGVHKKKSKHITLPNGVLKRDKDSKSIDPK